MPRIDKLPISLRTQIIVNNDEHILDQAPGRKIFRADIDLKGTKRDL